MVAIYVVCKQIQKFLKPQIFLAIIRSYDLSRDPKISWLSFFVLPMFASREVGLPFCSHQSGFGNPTFCPPGSLPLTDHSPLPLTVTTNTPSCFDVLPVFDPPGESTTPQHTNFFERPLNLWS